MMEYNITPAGVLLLLLLATTSAEEPQDGFQQHLEKLDQRFKHEIALLKTEFGTQVAELEQRIVRLEKTNEKLVKENADIIAKQITVIGNTGGKEVFHEPSRSVRDNRPGQKRALSDSFNIAFTAYVDHDLDNQGHNQVVVFNKVLLNHGGGYNNNTGAFTAPIAGVYSFTFFIGQRDVNQFYVHLVVNNNPMVDAIVDSKHVGQDIQGGNAANLMLSKGDSVTVRHHENSVSGHLEGSNGLRITSFSGFLVYPVESDVVSIVGK